MSQMKTNSRIQNMASRSSNGTSSKNLSTEKLLEKLGSLRDMAGEKHYERIKTVDQVLRDREWVQSPAGGGDEVKAMDRLESQYFGDLCGLGFSLSQALEVYQHVPSLDDWKKARFNLKKMWADWKAKQPTRRLPKSRAEEDSEGYSDNVLPSSLNELEQMPFFQKNRVYNKARRMEEELNSMKERYQRLREENKTLKVENKALQDQVKRYRRMALRELQTA